MHGGDGRPPLDDNGGTTHRGERGCRAPDREEKAMGEQFGTLSLEHSSTVDRVAEELRRAVFDGELESGTPLREVALADSLGVSRPTVREALSVLVAEGLAVREPNRGVAVATPDPASIRDVCRARAVLEGAGVRRWPVAGEELRGRGARRAGELHAPRSAPARPPGAQRAPPRLPRLAGRPDRLRAAGAAWPSALVAELRLALAQVDRIRRNAHDQADSHTHLVRLLERGDLDGASKYLARHLADAETSILDAHSTCG